MAAACLNNWRRVDTRRETRRQKGDDAMHSIPQEVYIYLYGLAVMLVTVGLSIIISGQIKGGKP